MIIYRDEKGKVSSVRYDEKKFIRYKGNNKKSQESYKKGKEHPSWKGGSDCYYRKEARKIMEKHIGRKLRKGEIVHHLDYNPKNNDIDNLHLFPDAFEHNIYHRMLKSFINNELGYGKEIWYHWNPHSVKLEI